MHTFFRSNFPCRRHISACTTHKYSRRPHHVRASEPHHSTHSTQSIKNIGRIPIFTDFLKFSCSFRVVDIKFTLDDVNEFGLDPTGNFARATGEELKAV